MAKAKPAQRTDATSEQLLEAHLRAVLAENAIRDGMGKVSKLKCQGCWRTKPQTRACVAAYEYLEALDLERSLNEARSA